MSVAPYGVRLLVGAATVAVEETIRLPKTILMYPITLVSQAAQVVMRFQQNLAELVIKGDSTLESIFPPREDQPGWATFDEDEPGAAESAVGLLDGPPSPDGGGSERLTEGRFALYSVNDAAGARLADVPRQAGGQSTRPAGGSADSGPSVAADIGYATLTLAQLRARLPSLSVEELETLLAYEQATKARAPFQTLLANRITRANAK
ncbi:lipid droplet-associated protein [Mycobacterium sp. THU-M116]